LRFEFLEQQRTKPKPTKGTFERMARMPRNQLLDNLFSLFREQQRWSIKPLRERTQQPEVYLKEVLSDIAFLHRSGEHNGLWELKANFKDDLSTVRGSPLVVVGWLTPLGAQIKPEDVPGPSGSGAGDVKMEDMDDDDEEEEDDDMEEVS
jgi:transcription initiation factor TFIIF subunit beta